MRAFPPAPVPHVDFYCIPASSDTWENEKILKQLINKGYLLFGSNTIYNYVMSIGFHSYIVAIQEGQKKGYINLISESVVNWWGERAVIVDDVNKIPNFIP